MAKASYAPMFETVSGALNKINKKLAVRARFAAVSAAVRERQDDLQYVTSDQAAFKAQKDTAGGKKTMKSYLWSICAAAYDAEHQG